MFNRLGMPCSVCGGVFRNTKSDREEHDRICNPTFRHSVFMEQIELESRQQEELGYFSKPKGSISSNRFGAYTSKLYQGIPSTEALDRSNNFKSGKRNNTHDQGNDNSSLSVKRTRTDHDESSSKSNDEDCMDATLKGSDAHCSKRNDLGNNDFSATTYITSKKGMDASNGFIIDKNSLLRINSRRSRFSNAVSSTERTYLELLKILYSINAPFHAFDTITRWLRTVDKNDLSHSISMKSLIHSTAHKYGLTNLFPQTNAVPLPSGNVVNVTKFCFLTNLYSILSDENLMKPSNLIMGDDIYKRFDTVPTDYNDIESGQWYRETQFTYCKNVYDVLCPIILYIDKTYVKSKPAEPISFTLGLFKRSVRNRPQAWRTLGMIPGKIGDLVPYVPNFKKSSMGEMRVNDWHTVVAYILSDLKEAQNQNGLTWDINGKQCCLHIPVIYIIGDIEGHDKVCSRKAGHSHLMNGVTHSCNIQRSNCSNINAKCRYLKEQEVFHQQRLFCDSASSVDQKSIAKNKLDQLGFYAKVENAFTNIDFGQSEYGVHGACAICLMHTFLQKYPNMVLDLYLEIYGVSDSVKGKVTVNTATSNLAPWLLRQSDRSFPILNSFTESFLKVKFTLSAKEKFARLFLLNLFCMTTYGWEFPFNARNVLCRNHEEIKRRVSLIEDTISIYWFLTNSSFPVKDLKRGKEEVKKYLEKFQSCVQYFNNASMFDNDEYLGNEEEVDDEVVDEIDERKGMDLCKFPKFHYLLHVMDQIERYGSTLNFDGSRSESHHKYLTKQPGERTQGRMDVFDEQTSTNLSYKLVLERIFNDRGDDDDEVIEDKEDINDCFNHITKQSATVTFDINENGSTVSTKWTKKAFNLNDNVLEFIKNEIFGTDPKLKSIMGFTELSWKGQIIRSHPNFRGHEWYDWVELQWEVSSRRRNDRSLTYTCPAKVFMFLEIKGHQYFPPTQSGCSYYALVHSTKMDENSLLPERRAHQMWKNRGQSKCFRYWTMEVPLRCVSVETINGLSFVYPDFMDKEMCVKNDFVIEVKSKNDWLGKHSASIN